MDEYNVLEFFTLKDHGDASERKFGPLVLGLFPAYEIFWRRYIAPLTNRVGPAVTTPPSWIRLRSDVSEEMEWMTMSHYSVFYYLARARQRMTEDKANLFPEDIFALLDTCRENVAYFFESMNGIFSCFSCAPPQLPKQQQFFCIFEDRSKPESDRRGFVRAQKYRNIMIHNPVIGRAIDQARGERS